MRILIVNQHSMNFGDDAAGAALIQLLMESPKVESVEVIYNGLDVDPGSPERVSVPKGVRFRDIGIFRLLSYLLFPRIALKVFRRSGLPLLVGSIQKADVVFVAPSGANIGIYRDWVYLVRLLIVVRAGGRPVFHFNSIGASGHRVFDFFARLVLRRSGLYVREVRSQKFLEGLGLESTLGPDSAFALNPVAGDVRPDVISVVPSELGSWHPDFADGGLEDVIVRDVTRELARFCEEAGLEIEILPHLRTDTERAFNARFASSLVEHGLDEGRVRILEIDEFREYDRRLGTSRLVVGGRYHSVVLAAKNFRPFVSLGYESKMTEACRYLEVPYANVDLLGNRDELADKFGQALTRVFADEAQVSAQLKQIVGGALREDVRRVLVDLAILDA